jgi:hypothetical protein
LFHFFDLPPPLLRKYCSWRRNNGPIIKIITIIPMRQAPTGLVATTRLASSKSKTGDGN